MTKIPKIPGLFLLHARDSNAELQRAQPEWYGPFLAEGECYKTPRTKENVAAACKAVGLDELSAEDAGERQFFADLIRELWVLFDDKLREIAGVEIDLDLSDVKPIRACHQPARRRGRGDDARVRGRRALHERRGAPRLPRRVELRPGGRRLHGRGRRR